MLKPPVLALDLDGVVADYVPAIKQITAERFNVPLASLSDPATYSLQDSGWGFSPDMTYFQVHADAVEEYELYSNLPVMPGAVEAVKGLVDLGVSIHIITSRFVVHGQHRKVVSQTVEWLDKIGLPYNDISFLKDKASVKASLFVDDAPSNITSIRESGSEVLIFDASYNLDMPGPRASNWNEAYAFIVDYLRLRKE